jgi:ribosomal-protein-alanine N-acetyltransferase
LADNEATRYYDDAAFTDVSQASDQTEAWENGFVNKRCIRWGIARKDDCAIIGSCGYYGFHTWHLRASIGYELAHPFWRQGIMTEALNAIIDLGFTEMGRIAHRKLAYLVLASHSNLEEPCLRIAYFDVFHS